MKNFFINILIKILCSLDKKEVIIEKMLVKLYPDNMTLFVTEDFLEDYANKIIAEYEDEKAFYDSELNNHIKPFLN